MLWIFFILANIISLILVIFGITYKKYEFSLAGAILFMVIGIAVFGTGLEIPTGWVINAI